MIDQFQESNLATWFEASKRGDSRAWGKLVEALSPLVVAAGRRSGLSIDDREDAFQAAFVTLYKNLDRIDSATALPRWMAVTATREAWRISRRTRGLPSQLNEDFDEAPAIEESAEDLVVRTESAFELRRALLKLGGRCLELLEALYIEEKAYEEVSGQLSMPIGAIGPTRARCLEKLRKLILGVSTAPHKKGVSGTEGRDSL